MVFPCSSFDQPTLQLLYDCNFFWVLPIEVLGTRGLVINRWKGLENTFPTVYYTPRIFEHYSRKTKMKKLVIVLA